MTRDTWSFGKMPASISVNMISDKGKISTGEIEITCPKYELDIAIKILATIPMQ